MFGCKRFTRPLLSKDLFGRIRYLPAALAVTIDVAARPAVPIDGIDQRSAAARAGNSFSWSGESVVEPHMALPAQRDAIGYLVAQLGECGVWLDMGRRQATLVFLALPAALLTFAAVALQNRLAPGEVSRILEALPGAAAFPERMPFTAQKRASFHFRLKDLLLGLFGHLTTESLATQRFPRSVRQNATSRILALDFVTVCWILL